MDSTFAIPTGAPFLDERISLDGLAPRLAALRSGMPVPQTVNGLSLPVKHRDMAGLRRVDIQVI